MEFSEVVRRRRMVRTYDPARPVAPEKVDDLVRLALRAPSAGFSQGWHFLVLEDAVARRRFWSATSGASDPDAWLRGMQAAPVLVLCLSDPQAYLDRYAEPDKGWQDRSVGRWPVPYWDVDTGMAALLMMLGAVDAELSSCFFGVPPAAHDPVRAVFGIPAAWRFVGVVSIGYGVADRRSPSLRRGRRPWEAVVSYGRVGAVSRETSEAAAADVAGTDAQELPS